MGDVFGEDQNASDTPAGRLPRANFPTNPRCDAAWTIPTVFVGPQGLSRESAAMNFLPVQGDVRKQFVMGTPQGLRSIHPVICAPAVAYLQVAHFTVEHRHSRRYVLDENLQQFLP